MVQVGEVTKSGMKARHSLCVCLGSLAVGCGSSAPGAPGTGGSDAGSQDAAPSEGATAADGSLDVQGSGDGMGAGDSPTSADGDSGSGDDGGGADGGVLSGPSFAPGFVPCGQSTLDDAAIQAACNGTMGGTPNPPSTTTRQCTALTGSVDVAVGCKEIACSGYKCIQVQLWVRVTARSSGAWTFDPGSSVLVPVGLTTQFPSCWSETQTPGGLVNDNDPGGLCGPDWTGAQSFTTVADATMARMVYVPGGTYTASGQPVSGTIWFPFLEDNMGSSTQLAFALAVPFSATVP